MKQTMLSMLHFPESLLHLVGIISHAYLASGTIEIVSFLHFSTSIHCIGPLKYPRNKLRCGLTAVLLIYSPFKGASNYVLWLL